MADGSRWFLNRSQRLRLPCKVSMNFILYLNLCYFIKIMKQLLSVAVDAKTKFFNECFYYILIQLLLIISGDAETTLDPMTHRIVYLYSILIFVVYEINLFT